MDNTAARNKIQNTVLKLFAPVENELPAELTHLL